MLIALSPATPAIRPAPSLLALKWAYWLMIDHDGHRSLLQRHGFDDEGLAADLGLAEMTGSNAYDPTRALLRLKHERQAFDQAFPAPDYPDRLRDNLLALGDLIGLDRVGQRLLGLGVLLQTEPLLVDAAGHLGQLGLNRTLRVLASLLDTPEEDFLPYLYDEGCLARHGLLEINARPGSVLSLNERLVARHPERLKLLRFSRHPAELLTQPRR